MNHERIDLSAKRVDQIFKEHDIENQLIEVVGKQWSDPKIEYNKSIMILDKYSYQHNAQGFLVEQTAGALSGTSQDRWGGQIAVVIPLEYKNQLWIFSAKKPTKINLNSKNFKQNLKLSLQKQMRSPVIFKDHEFGSDEPIKPFFVGNFPNS
jgi:hypothetical protein